MEEMLVKMKDSVEKSKKDGTKKEYGAVEEKQNAMRAEKAVVE